MYIVTFIMQCVKIIVKNSSNYLRLQPLNILNCQYAARIKGEKEKPEWVYVYMQPRVCVRGPGQRQDRSGGFVVGIISCADPCRNPRARTIRDIATPDVAAPGVLTFPSRTSNGSSDRRQQLASPIPIFQAPSRPRQPHEGALPGSGAPTLDTSIDRSNRLSHSHSPLEPSL